MPKFFSKKVICLAAMVVISLTVASQVKAPKLGAIGISCPPGEDITAEFTDAFFLECVRSNLGIGPADPVCLSQVAAKTFLGCEVDIFDAVYAENIDGIEYFTSLQELDMRGNKISDLTPIENITALKNINFANNEITDISMLDNLNPSYLNLANYPLMGPMYSISQFNDDGFMPFHNNISDISVLSGMNKLQRVWLAGNSISDISALEDLTYLDMLWLSNNLLGDDDMPSLSDLSNMAFLYLGNIDTYVDYYYNFNDISDISVINETRMPNMQELYLSEMNISDISPLAAFDNINWLYLDANPISDLSPIASDNTNIGPFCSVMNIYLNELNISNAANYAQAIVDFTALDSAGCNIYTDFSYEDCDDGIDNDGDGNTDLDDSYCLASKYYICDDTLSACPPGTGGAGCGIDPATPCSSLDEFGSERGSEWFSALSSPPYEDVEIIAKGLLDTTQPVFPLLTDGFFCDLGMFSARCSSNSLTLRSWSDDTADRAWIEAPLLVMGKNVTIDGVSIINNTNMVAIAVMGARDINITRNVMGWNGFGVIAAAGNGIDIKNNIFKENIGGIDIDTYFSGLFTLGVTIPSCGGVGTAGSKNISIVNNSFINNCDTFKIAADVFGALAAGGDPSSLKMQAADIAIASLEFLPITSVEDAIVKQNIVYNDYPGAHGYYYEPSFGTVNGETVPILLYDEDAVALGGNNVYSSTVDPYIDHSCADPFCFETDFYLSSPDDYATCDIAPETPVIDIFGNRRPDGPVEPGAFESSGGTCGGGSRRIIGCPVAPIPIDLNQKNANVTYNEGETIVELNWQKGTVQDANADKKIQIFSDYLDKNPAINVKEEINYNISGYGLCDVIDSEDSEKQLKDVYVRYLYNQILDDPELKEEFDKKLKNITDKEISVVKDLLLEIGIQRIFTDWWPYFAIHSLKENPLVGDIFNESIKKAMAFAQQYRQELKPFNLWVGIVSHFYEAFGKTLAMYAEQFKGFEKLQSTFQCINNEITQYFSYADGNAVYNPFNAYAVSEGWEPLGIWLRRFQAQKQQEILDAWFVVQGKGIFESLLTSIIFDNQLMQEAVYNIEEGGFNSLLEGLKDEQNVNDLAKFYYMDEDFATLKRLVFATPMASNIEACIEDNYRSILVGENGWLGNIRFQIIKDFINSDENCCDGTITALITDVIDDMIDAPDIKEILDGLTLEFINDMLLLGEYESNLGIETPFSDFYNENFAEAANEAIGGSKNRIYRQVPGQAAQEITSEDNPLNSSITTWTDEDVPPNNTGVPQYYKYYIVTETSTGCSPVTGREVAVQINPSVNEGDSVYVTLDLEITIKEAYDELFIKKLKKLFEPDKTSVSPTEKYCEGSGGDEDSDGICGDIDMCPGTTLDIPTDELRPNNYADIDGDGIFEWNAGSEGDPEIIDSAVTLADTYGCSCEQILSFKPGGNTGELKWGCTGSPDGLGTSATIGLWIDENKGPNKVAGLAADRSCKNAENNFLNSRTGASALAYAIACFSNGDSKLEEKMIEERFNFIPTFLKYASLYLEAPSNEKQVMLKQGRNPEYLMMRFAENLRAELAIEREARQIALGLGLNVNDIMLKETIDDLTDEQKVLIKKIPEAYFKNAGHAADLIIEKYDANNNLIATYGSGDNVIHADIFGEVEAYVGELTAGHKYTFKIKLADDPFVLPKLAPVTLNNATYANGRFEAILKFDFDTRFRFGNFVNMPEEAYEVINWHDWYALECIIDKKCVYQDESGREISIWDLYRSANFDGLRGIDLNDFVNFQENWVEQKEGEKVDEITFNEFVSNFVNTAGTAGANATQPSGEVTNIMDLICNPPKISWFGLLEKACLAE